MCGDKKAMALTRIVSNGCPAMIPAHPPMPPAINSLIGSIHSIKTEQHEEKSQAGEKKKKKIAVVSHRFWTFS
jgi:hypothetical protein